MRRWLKGALNRIAPGVVTVVHNFQTRKQRLLEAHEYVPLRGYLNVKKFLLLWKASLYAQQNYASLSNVYDLAWSVEREKASGAFVECGVWRGGCAAVLAAVAAAAGSARHTWLFDSFEGMPEATPEDKERAKTLGHNRTGGKLVPVGTNVATVDEVRELLFDDLRLDERLITIAKGWFQNTLPKYKSQVGPISILRLDSDWYESTKVCLENLYDQVISWGYVIIDDYGSFPGCRQAVDEFLGNRNLVVEFKQIDAVRVFFQKPPGKHPRS